MTDAEEITSLQEQLAAHRATLAVLLRQLASLGSDYAPPGVHHGIAEARAAIERLKAALRAAGLAVDDQAGDEATADEAAAPVGAPARRYLRARQPWIANYRQRRIEQRYVGSGHVEKANDLIVARRQKNRGMQWSEQTSDALAALRTLMLNGGWERYWQQREVLPLLAT
jgi:hypothetical protein